MRFSAPTIPSQMLFVREIIHEGTFLRDYIDVVDLAKAHVAVIDRMTQDRMNQDYEIFNVGTGRPVSVLELVTKFEQVNHRKWLVMYS